MEIFIVILELFSRQPPGLSRFCFFFSFFIEIPGILKPQRTSLSKNFVIFNACKICFKKKNYSTQSVHQLQHMQLIEKKIFSFIF